MATVDSNNPSVLTIDSSELDHLRSNVLKSQIATYRLLARNLPVSDSLLNSCSYKSQLATLIQNHVQQQQQQQQQSKPTAIILSNTSKSDEQNSNDTPLTFSSATNMYRSLVGLNEINEEKIPKRIQRHPINLNPLYTQQEQDKR
jgi:uncharacterized membrane protein YgaE (UPF0421/DUF939 family)